MIATPIGQRVLVRLDESATKIGSIILAEKSQLRAQTGVVVAVGPEVNEVKENDRVILEKQQGQEVKIGNEILLVIKEDNIIGITDKA